MNNKSTLLSALVLIVAANSNATSLGRHRGAALIGQPLDISVQAVLDAQEGVASLCLDADVFYAESRQDKSRVRVTAEKAPEGLQDAVIRIRSSRPVDEPVVTLYLRVGCQQKTERRYVILADMISEALPDRKAPLAFPVAPISQALVTPPASNSSTASLPDPKPQRKNRKTTNSTVVSGADVMPSEDAVRVDSSKNGLMDNAAQARKKQDRRLALAAGQSNLSKRSSLKLEPLDLSFEYEPRLKSSMELLTAPASNPQERSAAVAMWKALTAQPQEMIRDAEKLETMEGMVRNLQAQSQKTQLSINDLNTKLENARSERYSNVLVYVLVGLLLLAFAAVAYLMRGRLSRGRLDGGDPPWWGKGESQENLRNPWIDSGLPGESDGADHDEKTKKNTTDASSNKGPAVLDLDLGLDLNLESSGSQDLTKTLNLIPDSFPPQVSQYRQDFALSMTYPSRAVNAEELFDVQQQADFFVSIGQHDQAIEVLRNHIGEGTETSALVYLDLFSLYHQLARKDDYAALRDDFNRRFNTKVPEFEMYADEATGVGLEAYQMAMSRIEALWPSPKVLEIIEESIFRRPNNNAEAFNLEAYRELMMLYSVAKEIISPESTAVNATRSKKFDLPHTAADNVDSRPMTFMSTSIQPLSASISNGSAQVQTVSLNPTLASTVPPASLNLGLDVDLSEPIRDQKKSMPVDVSDAEFFAQFDKDTDALPVSSVVSYTLKKPTEDSDSLIDFDAFDAATDTSDKFKLPKT